MSAAVSPVETFHDFFVAAAGVAGALIGLLFVAISVAHDRLGKPAASQVHRVRAAAALTAFSNALVVSLFALDPGIELSTTATIVAVTGILFIVASLLSLLRVGKLDRQLLHGAVFLAGMLVVFGLQLWTGLAMGDTPTQDEVNRIAILVVVSFLIGISRAWELIGAPSIGIGSELLATFRHGREEPETDAEATPES